jgi:tetratricopeptide (TPR) repeat protein
VPKFWLSCICFFAILYSCCSSPSVAVDQNFSTAVSYYNNKNYTAALNLFSNIIQHDSSNVTAIYYAANCNVALNKKDTAIRLYTFIVKNYSNTQEATSATQALAKLSPGSSTADTANSSTQSELHAAPDGERIIETMVKTVRAQAERPNISTGFLSEVKEALNQYPSQLLLFLYSRGCKIYLTPTLIDKDPELANTQPKG